MGDIKNTAVKKQKLILNEMNEFYPKVSVIIPAKNEEQYIEACLQSVWSVDYPHDKLDVFLVDNGSTDKTVDIAKKNKATVLKSSANTVSSVRNYGAQKSTGEILAFLDADTVVPHDWIRQGLKLLEPEIVSAVGFSMAAPSKSECWIAKSWYHLSTLSANKGTREVNWLATFNLLVKRQYFEKVGGFDDRLITCEDVNLGEKLSRISKLISSDIVTVSHLGTDKTLSIFFTKEIWRGKGALRAIFSQKTIVLKEVVSVLVPVFFLVLQGCVFFSALFDKRLTPLLVALGVCVPAIFIARKVVWLGIWEMVKLWILAYIYLTARGLAIFLSIIIK